MILQEHGFISVLQVCTLHTIAENKNQQNFSIQIETWLQEFFIFYSFNNYVCLFE